MSGDRQSRSSSADPAPQFAVHEVETVDDSGLTVIGRCWFEPITVGRVFTQVALVADGETNQLSECQLAVESIEVLFGRFVDLLDQMWTARLRLQGSCPELLSRENQQTVLLIQDPPPAGEWAWDGLSWLHTSAPERQQT